MTLEHAKRTSPCRTICTVDGRSQMCTGCGRTLPEIAGWARYTDAQREEILADLPARLDKIAHKAS